MHLFAIKPARLILTLLIVLPAPAFVFAGLVLAQHGSVIGLVRRAMAPMSTEQRVKRSVTSQDPRVQKIASAIRAISADSAKQVAIIEWGALNFISYSAAVADESQGQTIPTVAEMEKQRLDRGWANWRGDCESKAVLAASLCEALGLAYEIRSNTGFSLTRSEQWTNPHVWVEVELPKGNLLINAERDLTPVFPRLGRPPEMLQDYIDAGLCWPDGTSRYMETIDKPSFSPRSLWAGLICGLTWFSGGFLLMQKRAR